MPAEPRVAKEPAAMPAGWYCWRRRPRLAHDGDLLRRRGFYRGHDRDL